MSTQPKTIYLNEYAQPDFLISTTDLEFFIQQGKTQVKSKLSVTRNTADKNTPLVLHGENLTLEEVRINDAVLNHSQFETSETSLTVFSVPDDFIFECITTIEPENNTSLEGLYKSSAMYCTQCEAEGFRKITYYLDRPDVMSTFTVKIIADKTRCPVLLSNGNKVDSGDLEGGLHWVKWHDPFKKPAYLFALVAGELSRVDDAFTTVSGKEVLISVFVEPKDVSKCDHAIAALKNAMKWDEDVYGREYDLDIYMIVAVDDFNMGAMENKGLNIFNTSCVLASPEITTDAGYQRVEAVVAHEYFHNWSGNRVTCRDWFQLSLKEGFTVFRDAEFSADMGSRTVKRVEDVSFLRSMQFTEDAGPLSHQVQPDSFIEISNFYTLTIYEKGAEIVRMIRTLIGAENFRKGSDLYFKRHDGQAVTIQDFVAAMAEVSGRDFTQFMHWYKQAGTPEVTAKGEYNSQDKTYTLHLSQRLPNSTLNTPEPFLIPMNISLLDQDGVINLEGKNSEMRFDDKHTRFGVIEFNQKEQKVIFEHVNTLPVPVLLREFSAPVKLNMRYSREDLLLIMQHESDGFSRWDASQQYAYIVIKEVMAALVENPVPEVDTDYLNVLRDLLENENLDPAMVSLMLTLPSDDDIGGEFTMVDVDSIHYARKRVVRKIAAYMYPQLLSCYKRLQQSEYTVDANSIAKRALKNKALSYLMETGKDEAVALCENQFEQANNMTDKIAAFTALVHSSKSTLAELQAQTIEKAYKLWKDESLAMNLWFSVQATSPTATVQKTILPLMQHKSFDLRNPNKLRSVIGSFTMRNSVCFHDKSGSGYQFLTEQILQLDSQNPQIASRLVTPLTRWKKYDNNRQKLMKESLERIKNKKDLSSDVFEVVAKSLTSA